MNQLLRRIRFIISNTNWLPVVALALAVAAVLVAVDLGNPFATIQALGLSAVALAVLSSKGE
jgi:hypothetical protein